MRQPTRQSEYSPAAETANRAYAPDRRMSGAGGSPSRPPQQPKKKRVIRLIDLIRLAFLLFVLSVVLLLFAFCGRRGEAGPMGLQGEQGIQGIQGEKGEKGEKGDTGAQGPRGVQGAQGVTGAKGEKGDKGDKGDQGAQGVQGEKGEKGDPGVQGPKGADGTDGKDGVNGKDGADGEDGVGVQYVYLDEDMNVIVILTNGSKVNAGALMEDVSSEGFAYTYLGDTCGISGIGTCSDADVVLARSYLGYDITEVCEGALSGCYTIRSLTIPQDLRLEIRSDAFSFCENLTEVTLPVTTDFRDIVQGGGNSPFSGDLSVKSYYVTGAAPKNMPYWCTTDLQGALYFHVQGYNTVHTYLIAYPAGSSAKSYELPADVDGVAPGAFMGASNLESIQVAEGNSLFFSVDGVLYGKCGSSMALVTYPAGKKGEEYTISSKAGGMNVTVLTCEAFYGTQYLKKVVISKELSDIEYAHQDISLTKNTSIEIFDVDPGNEHFIAIEGMLYERVPGRPGDVIPVIK